MANSALGGVLMFSAFLSGCASEQLYETGRAYQQQQCVNLPDAMRADCMDRIKMKHRDYERESSKIR